jgi:hypothetical protein
MNEPRLEFVWPSLGDAVPVLLIFVVLPAWLIWVVKYEGSVGCRAHVVSAPSTTLGNEWGPRPSSSAVNVGFALVEVTWRARGVTVAGLEEYQSVFALKEAKGRS